MSVHLQMMDASENLEGSDLAAKIRAYRHDNRVTQTDLAARLGVTQQTVARWERGLTPRPDLITRIRAEIERSPSTPAEAEIYRLPRADSPDDLHAEQIDTFISVALSRWKKGERLPDSVLNFVVEQLGTRE